MNYDGFVVAVREREVYAGWAEAGEVTGSLLEVHARRTREEAEDLAAQERSRDI